MNCLKTAGIGFLLCLLCLGGCKNASAAAVPTETTVAAESTVPETTEDPRLLLEQIVMVVTPENIQELEAYPNLKKADLSGSTCYKAIENYCKKHPNVEVIYTVQFGSSAFDSKAEAITVPAADARLDRLLSDLKHLTKLANITLPKTQFTSEELNALAEAYPELSIDYTVELLGKEYPSNQEELDLSSLTPEQVDDILPALNRLKDLTYVELMNGGSCSLSKADVKKLVDAAPETVFHYTFYLFNKTVSTTDEVIEFKGLNLGDDREGELREAMSILTGCKTLLLDSCGMSSEVLASIRDDYPRTELAWRIYFGKYTALTNDETIRAVYNVFDDTVSELKYCHKVKYMDIGHNEKLSDLSFIGYMPELEILIASQTAVSDLSGFENCKNLEFLELVFCSNLSDLTPLAGCANLKNLNVCYTKVSNLLPLDGLPLERFSCKQARVGANEQKIFNEIHPNCVTMFYGKEPYAGAGWRYTDNGVHYTEIYKKVRDVFGYDALQTD